MPKPLKNFRISAQGFYRFRKQLKMGTFEGVIVIGVQLKWYNFGQWESFRGLVDIRRMCVSFGGDVRFWRYKRTKKKQISAIAVIDLWLSPDTKINKTMWAWHAVRRCVSK